MQGVSGKPLGEQSVRLTSGSRQVYERDGKRSLFLAADQCADVYLSLHICFCKSTYFMQGMSENSGSNITIGSVSGERERERIAQSGAKRFDYCDSLHFQSPPKRKQPA